MPGMNRIVSLLPSATEIVCELGLGDQLVGVSHECDWPPRVRALPKVTRTAIPNDAASHEIDALVRDRLNQGNALYTLDLDELARIGPDLIVTQSLCDVCAVAETEVRAAARALPGKPRVIELKPMRLGEVFECLRIVADAAGVPECGKATVARLEARAAAVARRSALITHRPRVVFLEWIAPPFCAGHWTPELIAMAGADEAIGRAGQPSRTIRWEEIVQADPECVILSCCGYDVARIVEDLPIMAMQPGVRELTCVQEGRLFAIDGNAYFNRPGPRLVDGMEILAHALHPAVHPLPEGLEAARRCSVD